MANLQLVLVTPEKRLLDEPAESLRFPLFDGQIGIFPSRAPMVGRLGFGELIIRTAGGEKRFYIDGGFVQVKGEVVSLLTNDATPLDQLKKSDIQSELTEVSAQVAKSDAEYEIKSGREARLRKMLGLAH